MAGNEFKILCIGKVCLDELLYCDSYPVEDTVLRVLDRKLSSGGNAANNCKVLAELGVKSDLFGTLNVNSTTGSLIKEELESFGVNVNQCELIEGCEIPIAISIVNEGSGSRTFLYYTEDWPEVSYEAFLKIDLSQYCWIHVEMRKNDQLKQIVQRITEWNSKRAASGKHSPVPVSLEVENNDDRCLEVMPLADFVVVSKDFARVHGYNSMPEALDGLYGRLKPGATLVVPWAEEGAAARGPEGVFFSPAFPPDRVVDTLGAGDTFCAGLMLALARGRPLEQSLKFACQVAGTKVGVRGFRGLGDLLRQRGVRLE
ncbi:ketohexokinase-like isoform X2 [Schistocerca serialis cubense]|uniref:ketohexokinase-like isoform X2 n=1 Tax=Schistocerca serialis cubense TaxID=2023355 RepID=UPI00214EB220|nr:ketohexokinase-like isoform X2 [Schistocerca serialis cubense]XP_049956071.1 ketohexokinase-like isoform X2 [Schistocerca serialis cubense]